MALSLGNQAPDFTLASTKGNDYTLSINQADKPLVVYFYPADFTRGCTAEACSYRDSFDVFKEYEVDIIGISKDSVATHLKFQKEHRLPFELLADTKLKVAKQYDAVMPIVNVTKRITYLLDKTHKIVAIYDSLFMAKKHIDEMMRQVKAGKVS